MVQRRIRSTLALTLLGLPLLLCGCESLGLEMPDMGLGSSEQAAPAPAADAAPTTSANPAPVVPAPAAAEAHTPWYALSSSTPAPAPVPVSHYDTMAEPTNIGKTAVGKKVDAIRAQLDQVEADTNGAVGSLNDLNQKSRNISSSYFSLVAGINSRLQVGTTPGNPHLVQHWQEASAALDQFSAIGGEMSQLSGRVSNDASQVSYLLDETRATYGLSGAVDEDHDALKALEQELQKSEIQLGSTRVELEKQIDRHNDYVAAERRNLQTLSLAVARGEYYGSNLSNTQSFGAERDLAPVGTPGRLPVTKTSVRGGSLAAPTGTPFVVIRFNRPNVDYGQPLYSAMSAALKKNPNGDFEVLAVSPPDAIAGQGTSAYQRAQEVVTSMSEMGVPRERVHITTTSKANVTSPEVQVFLR